MEAEDFFEKLKKKWIEEALLAGFTQKQAEFLYEKVKGGVLSGGFF